MKRYWIVLIESARSACRAYFAPIIGFAKGGLRAYWTNTAPSSTTTGCA